PPGAEPDRPRAPRRGGRRSRPCRRASCRPRSAACDRPPPRRAAATRRRRSARGSRPRCRWGAPARARPSGAYPRRPDARDLKRAMKNAEIALRFDELADLYELDGAIVHRVLAYRNAAKSIRDSTASVEEMAKAGRVTELSGIGKAIPEKLAVLFETGEIPPRPLLKAKYPPGLVEITRLPGFGPKRARKLFDELGIASLDALREAAENERLREVPGFGAKAEEAVLVALDAGLDDRTKPRLLLSRALAIADAIAAALREHPAAERVEVAGSARRRTETCKDLDLVATASDPDALAEAFSTLPLIGEVQRAA